MKKLLFKAFAALTLLVAVTSCSKNKSEIIAKSWKGTELEVAGGTKLSADDIGGVNYTFNQDGSFTYTEAAKTHDGTWSLNEDGSKLTLVYEEENRTVEQQIKELSEEKMIIHGVEHGMERTVTLIPENK
ncbi:MAG TPA: lipocalin family protein [Cytophagaceae bacterium]